MLDLLSLLRSDERGQAEAIRLLVWVLVVIIIISFVVWLLNKLL